MESLKSTIAQFPSNFLMDNKENGRVEVPKNWFGFDLMRESDLLLCEAQTQYTHREGRGTHREQVIRRFLDRRLPGNYATGKGHIQDSENRQTSEFDIVIYNPIANMLLAESGAGRSTFPVETVHAVIEVRSVITSQSIDDALSKAIELYRLKRFYNASVLAEQLFPKDSLNDIQSGIPAGSTAKLHPGPSLIPVLLVGFESQISAATAVKKIEDHAPWSVLCLGKYYVWHYVDEPQQEVLTKTRVFGDNHPSPLATFRIPHSP